MLRKSSSTMDGFSDIRFQTNYIEDRFPFASAENELVYYPLGDLSYSPVDDYWLKSLPVSRLGSLDGDSTPQVSVEESEGILYPAARSVSAAVRQNYTDDLSLDEEGDFMSYEDAAPAMITMMDYEERTVKKLRIQRAVDNFEDLDVARLHLGEGGRQKLKSLLSATTKANLELRERVTKIAKVKFASIPQLFHMAKVCGLWTEAVNIARTYNNPTVRLSISRAS